MSSFSFVPGKYNNAQGTRNAFGALSDALVREGFPAMRSLDGDRERADQLRIWNERMVPVSQVNGRRVYGYRNWNGIRWAQIHPNTVAPPDSGNHVARRANDLAWPYNTTSTAAHQRAQRLARDHDITCEGLNFGEAWHWTFWGALGRIGGPAPASLDPITLPIPKEDFDMADLLYFDNGGVFLESAGGKLFWIQDSAEAGKIEGAHPVKGLSTRLYTEYLRQYTRQPGDRFLVRMTDPTDTSVYLLDDGIRGLSDPSSIQKFLDANVQWIELSRTEVDGLLAQQKN